MPRSDNHRQITAAAAEQIAADASPCPKQQRMRRFSRTPRPTLMDIEVCAPASLRPSFFAGRTSPSFR